MVLDCVFSHSASLWVRLGDSISLCIKIKNQLTTLNGIVKEIHTNSITVQLYSDSYVKKSTLPNSNKLAGLNYLTLTLKEINIKPENVVGCITVAHESFFADSTLPYHLDFEALFAIEKKSFVNVVKGSKVYGYVKVLPSEFSPLPLSMSLPLPEKKDSFTIYSFRCGCRAQFSDSMSKKGGFLNRATRGKECTIFEINHLFQYLEAQEESFKSFNKKKSYKLNSVRNETENSYLPAARRV
jgi:hypothetical protein